MPRNIIAIGGGDVGAGETLAIDRRFVSLVDKERPRLLFIPTATDDNEDYVAQVESAYRDRLGCEVDVLRLCSDDKWLPTIVRKLDSADLIYVGGGNTKAMLEKWRELGVDRELRRLVSTGKPVGGVSAGAICWFRVGNSDWPAYEQIPDMLTARLDCLGFVDLVLCPHTKNESFRLDEFTRMMAGETGVGVGLDDCCAIQIRDDDYRFIASRNDVGAHLIYRRNQEMVHEYMEPHDDFRPLTSLTCRFIG